MIFFESLVALFDFPGVEDEVADGGGVEGTLVLEVGREVDAVVLADVLDGLGWEFLGLGTDTHGFEDVTAARQIATEGPGRDIGQFCQFLFTDKTIWVVVIDHVIVFLCKGKTFEKRYYDYPTLSNNTHQYYIFMQQKSK